MVAYWVFAVLLVFVSPMATAQTIAEVEDAFFRGEFLEAANLGEAIGTPEADVLASRAITVYVEYVVGEKGNEDLIERALMLATKAVQQAPTSAAAHLQLTRALGRKTKVIGKIEAATGNYAKLTRDAIETSLQLDPEFAPAWISLGRWHVGIIARVGAFIAKVSFKATKTEAIHAFERALELAPQSNEVHLEYAISLLALNKKKNRNKAKKLLVRAVELPASDAYEQLRHDEAVERLATLETEDN